MVLQSERNIDCSVDSKKRLDFGNHAGGGSRGCDDPAGFLGQLILSFGQDLTQLDRNRRIFG